MCSSIPVQLTPSPSYPKMQLQSNDPTVFMQTAVELQSLFPSKHSSMSRSFIRTYMRNIYVFTYTHGETSLEARFASTNVTSWRIFAR